MASFTATAYGPPWGGIQGTGVTASGVDLRQGQQAYLVAVDPSIIPLGTHLRISPNPFNDPSIIFTASDTGGAIKGNRIDFYDWRGRQSQNAWGSRSVDVQVVSSGPSNSSRYPGLTVEPGVDIQDVNPTLLQRLSQLAQGQHVTVDVISGYRNSGVGGAAGFVGDPHSKGLAADVQVGGRPIADVLGWQTVERYGLRSGSDPSLQPFYQGGPDPAHVDLMDPSGTRPASGISYPFGSGFGVASAPSSGLPPLPTLGGRGTHIERRGGSFVVVDGNGNVVAGSDTKTHAAAVGVVDTFTSVGDFLGKLGQASFWIRVLEVGGGGLLILLGLAIVGRSLTTQSAVVSVAEGARTLRNATPGRRSAERIRRSAPRTRASTVRDYGTTRAPSASHLREAEKERRIRAEDDIPF